jgi:hypothetical protein
LIGFYAIIRKTKKQEDVFLPFNYFNKEFLETNYPRGKAIEAFRSFHFGKLNASHFDLRVKSRNSVFRFPFLLKQVQHRHGNDNLNENPNAERRGILF